MPVARNLRLFSIAYVRVRSSHRRCAIKKGVLKISQNSLENTCARVSFLVKLLACWPEVFFCESCEISKNTSSTEHLWTTASDGFITGNIITELHYSSVTSVMTEWERSDGRNWMLVHQHKERWRLGISLWQTISRMVT